MRTVQTFAHPLFGEIEVAIDLEGTKTSEGDGRTAADIERELAAGRTIDQIKGVPTEPTQEDSKWD